ncbi:unnamed protein product, partial [Urochloa humidicola]
RSSFSVFFVFISIVSLPNRCDGSDDSVIFKLNRPNHSGFTGIAKDIQDDMHYDNEIISLWKSHCRVSSIQCLNIKLKDHTDHHLSR